MSKRKTTHVCIKYIDGSEYNIRRGKVDTYVKNLVSNHWIILTKDCIIMKTPYGFYKKHKEIYIEKKFVDYIEQTNINGSITLFKEE